jgi:hypothetical protein
MAELVPSARSGDPRFLRHANAVTQAEIRRLSRLESQTEEQARDVIQAVQHELRRLATPRPRGPRGSDSAGEHA